MQFKILIILFPILLFLNESYSQSSVLSTGKWYKIGVDKKGIYKINTTTLQSLGILSRNIDPKNIAIYGNGGGGMLPQSNSTPRANDLLENAIFVSGENDGVFNDNDYILFYGNSPHKIAYNMITESFDYEKNLYSDTLYYFLTIKSTKGKRINIRENTGSRLSVVSTFQKFSFHEIDKFNILSSGRRWFGERISSGNNFNISFSLTGLVPNSIIELNTILMAQTFKPASFDIFINTNKVATQNMDSILESSDTRNRASIKKSTVQINTNELSSIFSGIDIEIVYNRAMDVSSSGFLDYLYLITQNKLSLVDSKLNFFTTNTPLGSTIELSNTSANVKIWDVNNPVEVVEQQYNFNNNKIQFNLNDINSEFYAFEGTGFSEPILIGAIQNQNLHEISASDAIFITHRNFITEANRLADHRRIYDGLSIEVVLVDQIYNEFSSGSQDITAIRDFLKYIYHKYNRQLKYVLLFGDCSYDYKGRVVRQTNFVPIYESRNSIISVESYSSDDYFGFMEDDEGIWTENNLGDHTLELGIGRLPVKTLKEAVGVVNKIIRYETSANVLGNWKKKIVFIADDEDGNIHQRDADNLSDFVDTAHIKFNTKKIFLDSYNQIVNSNGVEYSPDTRAEFLKELNKGIFIFNYTGHGNQSQLTLENIIDLQLIGNMVNRHRLSFFITATCDFGVYDNPLRVSGGESLILNPNGGSIGLLTSTRKVFANTNFLINRAFFLSVFQEDEDGKPLRLGDVLKKTKNNSLEGYKNRSYSLIADPTMRLAYPKYNIKLTLVNGLPINEADTLKSQQLITIAGEVINSSGAIADTFTGIISVEVYDKETVFITLGARKKGGSFPQTYNQRNVLLFKGEATITNGMFNFSFIVPKSISYVFGTGKVSMYAINESHTEEASDANTDLIIGGSGIPLSDNTPPKMKIYLNDTTFELGQTVSQNPVLLVKLFDESGINISSAGFGKDLTFILDNDNPVNLNEFYSASLDTYKEGWVTYNLSNLKIGSHTLIVKAYDINNNATQGEINFLVVSGNNIKITNVFNAPNPVTTYTNFNFTHDRKGEELIITLKIINLQGRVITDLFYRFDDSPANINNLQWNLKDANGNRIKKGIYIYKLSVQSTLDGGKNEVNKRLIILN